MFFARKRAGVRLAAAAMATGLFAGGMAAAGPAYAEDTPENPDNPRQGGATATLEGMESHLPVVVSGVADEPVEVPAGLFQLTGLESGTLQAYCIDFATPARTGAEYKEAGWDESTLHDDEDAPLIHWILQNSYPQVDTTELAGHLDGVGTLSPAQAAAATQAAIWELSDELEDARPEDDDAALLTEWLLENAEEVPEPAPSLQLGPVEVSGKPGEDIGPVTLDTSADGAVVTLGAAAAGQGITLVGADGQDITPGTPVAGGTELFFRVPEDAEDGLASLTASITTQVPVGRAFTGTGEEPTQTMILAGSSESSVSAQATASWASQGPSPSVTAKENCAEGGVEITASNSGDEPFEFVLEGETHEVLPGESTTVLVPVQNGQGYGIRIENPLEGKEPWMFRGTLDCAAEDGPQVPPSGQPNEPEPAGGSGTPQDGGAEEDDGTADLAETGSSGGSPVLMIGIAVVLLVVGAAVVVVIRRRAAANASDD